MKNKNKYFFIIFILFLSNSQALELKWASESKTINATISAQDLNRIFVKDDRILSVRGIQETYLLTKDLKAGDIFIKPTVNYQNHPFTIFITTEQGRTFNLFLTPLDVPSEMIELRPTSPSKVAEHWEEATPYSDLLTKVIGNMMNHQMLDGYPSALCKTNKTYKFGQSICAKLKEIYQGSHLKGEVWEIKNISCKSLCLDERYFYQYGTRAIALENHILKPGVITHLYRVLNNE